MTAAPPPSALPSSVLLGSWHLTRWEIVQDGRSTLPFGDAATGLIVYAPDGFMSACIAAGGRRGFSTGNPRSAPAAEKEAALESYFHYAGTFDMLHGPKVVHRVTHALNPGFVGTEQVRDITLEGDTLTLSATEPLSGGGQRHHRLIWRR